MDKRAQSEKRNYLEQKNYKSSQSIYCKQVVNKMEIAWSTDKLKREEKAITAKRYTVMRVPDTL